MTIKNLELLSGGSERSLPSQRRESHTAGITETAGMFLGMSIVDATKKLLGLRKRTMSNTEILAELKKGGLVLTSVDPLNVVGSVLTRRFNHVGDVVRVGRGIWGLKEWYPGRTFKSAKSASESDRPEGPQPPIESEEDASQRIIDEIMGEPADEKQAI